MNRNGNRLPFQTGPVPSVNWVSRHLQFRHDDQDADRQADDGADLEEGRQVVARRQQQPHRQYRGDGAVADQHPGDLDSTEGEMRRPFRTGRDLPAEPDRTEQEEHPDDRDLADPAGADEAHVDAHEQRDGNGREDGEHAPGAVGQSLHHDQREHREDDDHDQEGAEQRDGPGHLAHFLAHQLAQRAAVAAAGDEQDHEVLHRAGEDYAGDQPEGAGQVAHLRGKDRTDQRTGAGDGGEVVAEEDVLVGRDVVQAIVVEYRGSGAVGVQLHHLAGDEQAVVTVGDQVDGHRRHHDPQGVDRFATTQGDDAQGRGAHDRHHQPGEVT